MRQLGLGLTAAIVLAASCAGESETPEALSSAPTTASVAAPTIAATPVTEPSPQERPFCPDSISWRQTRANVGARARVEGRVIGAVYASDSSGQPTFLNVGRNFPSPGRFTVVIWGDDRGSFPYAPERRYAGRNICVHGTITTYEGVPQVFVDEPSDIEIDPKQ